jgi:YVTN family beta-propeller protein
MHCPFDKGFLFHRGCRAALAGSLIFGGAVGVSVVVLPALPVAAATMYTVTAAIGVGTEPRTAAVDPTTDTAYVINQGGSGGNTVSVIDGATNAVTATIGVAANRPPWPSTGPPTPPT